VVKAIIYGKSVSKFEEELARAAPRSQFELFRKRGVVGRLHNFVNGVLISDRRRELFMAIQRKKFEDDEGLKDFITLNLIKDGGIRWNSIYLMLLRCYELRDVIDLFL
jgi:hypothetical protein